ncbi:NUDIX domain-containing protein [Agrococcus jejuensis]|uniref:8-oxo-dGTP pyrophosphatase MutT, NUDIX family n=1 Tax=Agrococcus jejuensis TaxID=399736 RepID=A0A1G8H500_9MICO|nr:NUDIX domain-containing protein [Agrococcus jejuensis]SDI01693.1 8-oxo-dGTP pyrophosphatase MutT, NUDIX family [Agrococcus jejuensis]
MPDDARGVRRTARVLCVDETGATLLFHTRWDLELLPPRWLTPGGGIEAGETEREAAVRELFEETGQRIRKRDLVGPIGHARVPHPDGHPYSATDAVTFLWRTPRFTPVDDHRMADELDDILAHRWWTADEIRASDDDFSAEDVLGALDRLAGGAPQPGDAVRVEGAKWNGKPHWRYDARVLGTDEHGLWIGVDAGTTVQKGWRKEYLTGHAFVRLVPPTTIAWDDGSWMLPGWWDRADVDAYVDVTTPPTVRRDESGEGWIVEYVDLDLDLVVPASGLPAWIDDEDEFSARSVSHGWPSWLVERARAVADDLLARSSSTPAVAMEAGHAWLAQQLEDAEQD